MGFLDVISGKQSVGSWLTGRSPDEEFIYNNEEGVAAAVEYFNNVATKTIPDAQKEINTAVEALNSLPGIDGCFPSSLFDDAFTSITSMVTELGQTMQQKGDDIIAYGNASFGTKFLATLGMTLAKPAEGFLSAFEDIGDGVLSIVGFGAGLLGFKDAQNSIGNFVKKDFSHDTFQYDKWAKYSAFTEDSAISGGLKLVGKTAGYLYAGGAFSAIGKGMGLGSSSLGRFGLKLASSSTWGATGAAFMGGIGGGTAAGLQSGMDYNQAFAQGLKTGAVQGAFAFAGGKIGEKLSKVSATRQANKLVNSTDDTLTNTTKQMDDAFNNLLKGSDEFANTMDDNAENIFKNSIDDMIKNDTDDMVNTFKNTYKDTPLDDVIKNNTDETIDAAIKSREAYNNALKEAESAKANLDTIKSTKIREFEGYTDRFTKAGQRHGESLVNTVKTGGKALKDTASASYSIRKGSIDANMKTETATVSQNEFKAAAKDLITKNNPVAQAGSAFKTAASDARAGLASLASGGPKQILPNIANATKNALPQIPGALANTARAAAPILPAVAYNEIVHQSGNTPVIPKPDYSEITPTPRVTPDQDPIPPSPTPTDTTTTSDDKSPVGTTGGSPSGSGGYTGGGENGKTVPTTAVPTTTSPTKATPTTVAPTTATPTTATPTTASPTTASPTTAQPTKEKNVVTSPEPTPTTSGGDATHGGYEYGADGVVGGESGSVAASLADLVDDTDTSIDDIIKGSKYSRIPTSSKPISAQGGSSSVIPIAAGLTAASAAGLGAKAYMDYKRSQEEDDEDEEEYEDEDYVDTIEQDDDLIVDGWTEDEEPSYEATSRDNEFINIDRQDEDEYYRESENPVPIAGTEELEEF